MGGIVPLPDEILPELEKLDAEVTGGEEGQHGNR
jgi:hypothetical protein